MPFTNPNTHSMGGKASAAKLTPEQRKLKAQNARQVRTLNEARKKAA